MNILTSSLVKLAAGASVLAAGAALSQTKEGGDKEVIHKVIMLAEGKDASERMRELRILRGANGEFRCPDGAPTKVEETAASERTKVLICGNDKLSDAERANKLEEMLARIRSEDHFGAAHKAKVEAALTQAIERLRATQ
ncbi:MAG TPA: hypothetical protein VEZ70_02545 [Allosphingosinicella sp.]|nr:hypothetical protein [Allosphingosinicella sp.]